MLKTAVIGKTANGTTQLSRLTVMSGDRIVLVDATTGQPPKKVTTKIVNKDLHIFAEGATEPSVILNDYVSFEQTVEISGLNASGAYVNYATAEAGSMELGATPAAVETASAPIMSTSAWWGVGILAVAGGVAAAAGGGGGGSSSTTPPVSSTQQTSILIDDVLIGVDYYINGAKAGTTGSNGSFTYNIGDTVTFKVGNATLGSFAPLSTTQVVTISDLTGGDTTKTANIAKFLQSLDSDTNEATITISTTTANSITTTANVQTDPTAGGQVTLTVTSPDLAALGDIDAPTATIAISDPLLNSGETATVTITFSEAVAGFSNADVTVQNGTVSTFTSADGGITWTATFTPTANLLLDDANVITLANTYTDQAGNAGTSAQSANYTVNTMVTPSSAPTLTIGDDEPSAMANIAGGSITYTFTFGDTVTGFTADDIIVTGGGKGAFGSSGDTYTLVVTPTAGYEGNVAVSVAAGAALGTGSAQSLAANSSQLVDMSAPTSLTLTLNNDTGIDPTDKSTSSKVMNISTPETGATWEYSLDGGSTWTVGNGTSFNLANNTTYSINTIQVRQTDAADNVSVITKNTDAITIDINAPILTITDNEPTAISNMDGSNSDGTTDADGGNITYTFKFTDSTGAAEDVAGFGISDITITNGTAKTFTQVSKSEYTLEVIPDRIEGVLSVQVLNTAYQDIAGNSTSASSMTASTPQAFDMIAPVLIDTAFDGVNDWVYDYVNKTITFKLDSQLEAVNMTNPGGFNVYINTLLVDVEAVAMLNDTVTLIMPKAAADSWTETDSVRVVYKDVTTDMTPAIQDLAGNDATSFTYLKPDVTPPTVKSIIFEKSGLKIGDTTLITVNFSEEIKDILVSFQNGTLTEMEPNADDSSIWTATFTATADVENLGSLFTVVDYHDLNGLEKELGTLPDTYTYGVDTRSPSVAVGDDEFSIANIAGGTITYTFTFSEDVYGFTVGDVKVANAQAASSFATGADGDSVYTLVVTPDAGFEGNVTIDVAAGKVYDLYGNPNIMADQSIQKVDMLALDKPSFSLKTDSGVDDLDGITNVSLVNVTVESKTWEYRLDSGATWNIGNGTTFNLANGTYNPGDIGLRQSDAVGNISAVTYNTDTIVVDKTAPRFSSMDTSDYANGNIVITMSESLNSTDIAKENFTVSINGIPQTILDKEGVAQPTFGASISDTTIVITGLSFNDGDSIKVAYSDLSSTDTYPGIKDLAGNNAVGFTSIVSTAGAPTAVITMGDTNLKVGEASTVTITFSEAVKNFTNSDMMVEGGTLSALSTTDNIVWTATFTPSTDYENNSNAISISGDYTDLSGNSGSSDTIAYNIDTLAPTITITDSESSSISNLTGGAITYTFSFSEAVSGFTASDIIVSGGTKGTFTAVSSSLYTLVITPTVGYEGNLTVDVAASSASDSAGNGNTIATQSVQEVDKSAPALTITDDESAETGNIAGGSITYTFTFSEDMVGFTADDIVVTNGLKGTFTAASSSMYTLVVTPISGFEGDVTVSVAALNQTDAAGNTGALVTVTQTVDMTAPTAPTLGLEHDLGVNTTDNITSDPTIAVSGIITGATWEYSTDKGATWVVGSGSSFDLAVNTAYAIGDIQVRQTDAAGNVSNVGQNSEAITIDTKGPILTIADNEPNITANMDGSNGDGSTDADGADILYTFTFNEAVHDFDLIDIDITNGGAGTFTKVSDTVYTLGVTPAAGLEDDMSVAITGDYHDNAGNATGSESMTSSVQKVDTLAPTYVANSIVAYSNNDTILLTFDQLLDTVSKPNLADFAVAIGGITIADALFTVDISQDLLRGNSYLKLIMKDAAKFNIGDVVSISYNDNTGDVANAIQDLAGNDVSSFGWVATTATDDVVDPTATVALLNSALKVGETTTLTVTFSEVPMGFVEADDLTVQNGLLSGGVFDGTGKIYTATFTPTDDLEDTSNVITLGTGWSDGASNAPIATTDSANYTIDTKEPTFVSMVADESLDTIVMTFSEALDTINLPTDGQFAISLNGGANLADTTYSVAVSGSTVTLTLDNLLIVNAQTAKVTYTDSTAGNDVLAIQDLFGNDTLTFNNTVNAVI